MDKQPITIILQPDVHYYPKQVEYWPDLYPFVHKLLQLFHHLENTRHYVNIQIALSSSYYQIFESPEFQKEMDTYLKQDQEVLEYWHGFNKNINKLISALLQRKSIQVLATSTGILPYATTSVGTQLQIRNSLTCLQKHLQIKPEGFWFPYGMYAPGLDLFLMDQGFSHTFISSETIKFADPPPIHEGRSIVKSPHGLTILPIHTDFSEQFSNQRIEMKDWLAQTSASSEKVVIYSDISTLLARLEELGKMDLILQGSEKGNLSQTEENVHLCQSFLPEVTPHSLFSKDLAYSWTYVHKMEQLVERNSTYHKDESMMDELIDEWLDATGRISTGLTIDKSSYKRFYPLKEVHLERKEQKRKVLLLSWEYPPNLVGGLARHVGALAESLVKIGFEVHILTANTGELPETEAVNGVFIHRVEPLNSRDPDFLRWIGGLNLAMERKARELRFIHSFSLIHAHDWLVGACAMSLKTLLNIPLVTTIHATESGRNGGILTEMQSFIHKKEKQLIEHSEHIIVCSVYMKNEVIDLFQHSENKMTIIPNGVEHVSHHQTKCSAMGMPYVQENGRLIFSIGRMVQEKGFETIIEAANELCATFKDIYFVIAGRGPLLEEYRSKVKEYKLENRFYFPGFISDQQRAELFSMCEMAVFPSNYEPFGIVALEAMAAGKPVIASNTGGLKGIVQHGSTGLLMNPGDPDSLIDQASFLLSNKEEAITLGINGKRVADSLFSWNRTAELTKRVYEEILIESKMIIQK